ncbi:DUF2635 domain-containing protein [Candidatus Pantoea formicae]|uniref:DUF2635 domain-containing protein n=1 Tax=Candidatus Pantoea formicae TaxID=2608355 RepID=UPI003ED8B9C5
MKVKAKSGLRVPREENPRRYISDSEALEVGETAYYLRRIADGDLLRVEEDKAAAVVQAAVKISAPEPATASVSKTQADTSQPTSGDNGAK